MPISVVCPGCKVRFNVNEKFAGKKGPCPKCKKYMLVEQHDQGKVVPCLLCKTPIRVGGSTPPSPSRHPRPRM